MPLQVLFINFYKRWQCLLCIGLSRMRAEAFSKPQACLCLRNLLSPLSNGINQILYRARNMKYMWKHAAYKNKHVKKYSQCCSGRVFVAVIVYHSVFLKERSCAELNVRTFLNLYYVLTFAVALLIIYF